MRRRWAIVKRYLSVDDPSYLGQAIVKRYSSVGDFLIKVWFIFKIGINRRMSELANFLTGA